MSTFNRDRSAIGLRAVMLGAALFAMPQAGKAKPPAGPQGPKIERLPQDDPSTCVPGNLKEPLPKAFASPHHLYLMYLTAPPGVKNPDWALQSTSSTPFASCNACLDAFGAITSSLKKVSTITVDGWCLNNETVPKAVAEQAAPPTSAVPTAVPRADATDRSTSEFVEFQATRRLLSPELNDQIEAEIRKNPDRFTPKLGAESRILDNTFVKDLPAPLERAIADAVKAHSATKSAAGAQQPEDHSAKAPAAAPASPVIRIVKPLRLDAFK
jgi:hypothetical protein